MGFSAVASRRTTSTAGASPSGDAPVRLTSAIETVEHNAASLRSLADAAESHEKVQRAEAQRSTERAARRREVTTRALLDASLDRARLDVEEHLRHSVGYAYEPWESDLWSSEYDQPVQPAPLVVAATLGFASPSGVLELPLALPVLGSNLLITHEPGARDQANAMAQAFVVRALAASLPGSLRVHLLDPGGLGQNLGLLSRLNDPLATGGVRASQEEVGGELASIRTQIHRLNSQVLLGPDDSLVTRWFKDEANGIPCSLIYAAGVSSGMNPQAAEQIWAIARTGKRCGVSIVAVVDTSRDLPNSVRLDDLAEHSEHIHIWGDGSATWASAPKNIGAIAMVRPPQAPTDRQHAFLNKVLAPAAKRGSTKPILLADIIAQEPMGSGNTAKAISAPIGRAGDGEVVELGVGDDEGVAIGGLMVGPSGSGKTTLLHAFIHSLVHRYSPQELELYLLDMKAGVEFAEYAPRPGRPALPHVRAVGIEADANFALGVLHHLLAVDRSRKMLFKEASVEAGREIKNLTQYRAVTGKVLPRVLFVGDEFQLMLAGPTEDEAWDALDVLAKQGRSQGVHVLLATQSLASIGNGRGSQKSSIFDQLELRVGLRAKPDELSRLFDRMVRDRLDTGRRGSGVLNPARGDVDADQLFQAGMLDDAERSAMRQEIVARYGPDQRIRVSRGSGGVDLADVSDIIAATTTPTLYVGAPVGVNPPLIGLPLAAGDGRGLVLANRDESKGVGAIAAMLASLAMQKANADAKFIVLDFMPDDVPSRRPLDQVGEWLGDRVERFTEETMGGLQEAASGFSGMTYVAVVGVQYNSTEVPMFPSPGDPPHPYQWLFGDAPSQRVFPLVWVDTPDRMRKLGSDADRLQLRADTSNHVIDASQFLTVRPPYAAPRGRMWFHDIAGEGVPVLVDPFRINGELPPLPPHTSR
ncbi:MAG TPA: FtsK/SpoIIIE domain-containing protein [Jiangellaceae bacterium]